MPFSPMGRVLALCLVPRGITHRPASRVHSLPLASFGAICFAYGEGNGTPPPVLLPGEPQGRGGLVGCRLWGRTESDTTEATSQQQQQLCLSRLK